MKRFLTLLLVSALLLASCTPAATPGTDTTAAPEDGTTATPDGTTATPADTTAAPVDTTAAPVDTTAAPADTTVDTTVDTTPATVFKSLFDVERMDSVTTTFSSDVVKVNAIDKKYAPKSEGGYTYVNIEVPQMVISGFPFADTNIIKYYRMDASLYNQYPTGSGDCVQKLAQHSAGARVRFKTNATTIWVNVTLKNPARMNHMPDTGSCGCDVYVGSGANPVWVDNVRPGTTGMTYNKEITLPAGIKEVMIVLPLYSGISSMSIGMLPTDAISSPDPYVVEDPVVYYGSSITQGACASRPGMSYADITTRMLGANLVNLGFSSSAKGETIVGETIARIKMSAFVYDYDHNGGVDNLRATHYNFYKIIRNAQPDVPIIMISRFSWGYSGTDASLNERREIIKATYNKAIAEGDKNVYFIDGADVYPAEYRDYCLVDGTHPNDLGMYFIANAIYPVLKDALTKAGYLS